MILNNLPNEYNDRLEKLKKLKELGINPYPSKSKKEHSLLQCFNFEEGTYVHSAGRIILKREMGKIIFCHIKDFTHTMQIVIKIGDINDELFDIFNKYIDIGDFIEVEGEIFFTKKGEKSILVKSWKLLTKSLLPLPEKWHGLSDEDLRYRKRYLDFLTNERSKDLIIKKSLFWDNVRKFLKERGFLEVDTPYLEHTTGGADAKPFITHHNWFDMDVYLRISVGELWQKRMLIGGFEKIFEIGKVFRNEGGSAYHLQEFMNCEFYMAYADFNDGMEIVKDLYRYIAINTFGTTKFKFNEYEFDLNDEWQKIDYKTQIQKDTGIDIDLATDEEIALKLNELNVKYEAGNRARLIDSLWKYCRKKISGPAFLINEPKIVSPLAKSIEGNDNYTQRFHVILAGTEIGNGYSELNDPLDQFVRFEEQQKLRNEGDEEAQMADYEFVEALMHGMPPTCGFGFGQRLFSTLYGVTIRESETFPFIKPKN